MSQVPDSLRYRESHEWIDPKTGTVGITDHAQSELQDLVYVELPKVGAQVKAGTAVAVVESVKSANDIYAPVSGEIVEVNTEVSSNSVLVNTDPYGKGWLLKIRPSDPAELDALMDAAAYQKHIG